MTNNLQPYPEYKHSGLPWLGRIPTHWGIRASKRMFRESGERARPDDRQLSATQSHGVILQEEYERLVGRKVVRILNHLDKRKHVEKDDFVISMRSFQGGLERAWCEGAIRSSYVVLKPAKGIHVPFFAHLFKSQPYIEALRTTSEFIRDGQDLTFSNFCDVPLPVVPLDEQEAIANLLDANAVKVNRFIRNRRRLIDVLNEQKQAIINRTITRGLDPNVPLKPAGIDWLGDIPEHWGATTLGRLVKSFKTGPFGSLLHQSDYVPGGVPLVNPIHMSVGTIVPDRNCAVDAATFNRLREYALAEGDFVFSRRGELGRCALVRKEQKGWLIGTGSIRARLLPNTIDHDYLIVALQGQWVADYLSLMSVGATMQSLNTGILSRVPLPLPPIEEQAEIPLFIEHESIRTVNAIEKAYREIDLIREHRMRLIADVVTGKLDVRGLAPAEPLAEADSLEDIIDDEEMLEDDEPELVEEAADADD